MRNAHSCGTWNVFTDFCDMFQILSLDKNLKEPKLLIEKYGVITIGMTVCTVIATAFGTLGYWSFGPMEENVLRYLPYDDGYVRQLYCFFY